MTGRAKKILLASTLAIVAAGVLAGGSYWTWLEKPPAMPTDINEAMAVLKSPRYQRLPESRREPYLEKTRLIFEALSQEERAKLRESIEKDPESRKAAQKAMEDRMYIMAKEYVTADAEKRKQRIDQFVAMMELGQRMQRLAGSRAATAPADEEAEKVEKAKREERMKDFTRRMQEQVEKGNPQRQQYVSEFFKAVRDRRAEMGLDPSPPPPRR